MLENKFPWGSKGAFCKDIMLLKFPLIVEDFLILADQNLFHGPYS